jgi:hypothetical protein
VEPGFIQTPIGKKALAAEEALRAQLPAEALKLYEASLRAARASTERDVAKAATTEVVVQAVVHALTARRPRTRYVVGNQSSFQISFARALPDRWRDALIARHMGLK